jgi:outer membrane protein assembly factor BamB
MALSSKTGDIVWSTDRQVKVSWSSPIIVNTGRDTELLLASDPLVAGYNPENGKELWQLQCISGEVGPSLAFANGIVFSVSDYSQLSAIKLGAQPTILWSSDEFLSDIPSPVANEKYLILATSYGTVVCYDVLNGEKYWEQDFSSNFYSSPMLVGNMVYLLDRKGVMHIFNADKEYKVIGEPALGEASVCTPAFTDGRIYLRGENNLYCIGK